MLQVNQEAIRSNNVGKMSAHFRDHRIPGLKKKRHKQAKPSLKNNMTWHPENQGLEDDFFWRGRPGLFSGAFWLVSGGVGHDRGGKSKRNFNDFH